MSGATAVAANFKGCKLFQTDCRRLNASQAVFDGADLAFADLSHANLQQASFAGASLRGTNLHAVDDTGTVWSDSDRSAAKPTDPDRLAAESWKPPPLEAV